MPCIERGSLGTEVSYDTIQVRIAEVHSIAGVEVAFILNKGAALAFEAFSRSISGISGCNNLRDLLHQVKWTSSGKKYAPIYAWPLRIPARNGSSYEVIAHVRYMCNTFARLFKGSYSSTIS